MTVRWPGCPRKMRHSCVSLEYHGTWRPITRLPWSCYSFSAGPLTGAWSTLGQQLQVRNWHSTGAWTAFLCDWPTAHPSPIGLVEEECCRLQPSWMAPSPWTPQYEFCWTHAWSLCPARPSRAHQGCWGGEHRGPPQVSTPAGTPSRLEWKNPSPGVPDPNFERSCSGTRDDGTTPWSHLARPCPTWRAPQLETAAGNSEGQPLKRGPQVLRYISWDGAEGFGPQTRNHLDLQRIAAQSPTGHIQHLMDVILG